MTAPVRPAGALTGPQLEALRLSANGWTSERIGRHVGTTRGAIDLRLKYAARSLGASSRTHAVALAMARGLIDPADIRPAHATNITKESNTA